MKSKTLEERQALKKKLNWGDVAKIAKLAEVDRKTVDRWFNGESNNTVISDLVYALFEKRKEKIADKIEQL